MNKFALRLLLLPALAATLWAQTRSGGGESKYIGPGSCGASACHGSVQPMNVTRVLQNEYSVWVVRDPHAKAYRSLENEVSQRMGRILGIGDPTQAQKCLVCHALDVSASRKGRQFDLSDGVSCESCHGPASAWLGPHTLSSQSHEANLRLGMVDLRGLTGRSELCLTCHLGTAEKQVDHEMIAAGHPDLVFELDTYSAIMPPHWKPAPDPDFGLRDWSVGQAVDLRDALLRLERHARSQNWPEYSDLDCFSCHHSLTTPQESWRQERGYPGHQTGAPPFNDSHFAVFRVLAAQLDASAAAELESALKAVYKATSRYNPSASQVAEAAAHAASVTSQFVSKSNSADYSRALTGRLLAQLAGDGNLATADTRTAEQAAMALDSLYISYSKEGGQNSGVRSSIDGLFKLLQNPSAYNAPSFRAQLQRVSAALREAGVR